MQGSRKMFGRPSPAMIVAVIALIVALGGTAIAAKSVIKLPKNSVGSRQLKKKSVTTGKLANNAVNGAKVANGSLTGQDINLGALGKVPSAVQADSAGNSNTVGGHSASCPGGTILLRGICFDSSPSGFAHGPTGAADACAARGGWLPTVMELYSVRSVINLGDGSGNNHTWADSFYVNPSTGSTSGSLTVDGTGKIENHTEPQNVDALVVCAYPLVR